MIHPKNLIGIENARRQVESELSGNCHNGQSECPKCAIKDEERKVANFIAKNVTFLYLPVTACMLFVLVSLHFLKSYQNNDGIRLYVDLLIQN